MRFIICFLFFLHTNFFNSIYLFATLRNLGKMKGRNILIITTQKKCTIISLTIE